VFLTGRLLPEASRFLLNLICWLSVSLQILLSLASACEFFSAALARGLRCNYLKFNVFLLFSSLISICRFGDRSCMSNPPVISGG
jgi:hypothetical protein